MFKLVEEPFGPGELSRTQDLAAQIENVLCWQDVGEASTETLRIELDIHRRLLSLFLAGFARINGLSKKQISAFFGADSASAIAKLIWHDVLIEE